MFQNARLVRLVGAGAVALAAIVIGGLYTVGVIGRDDRLPAEAPGAAESGVDTNMSPAAPKTGTSQADLGDGLADVLTGDLAQSEPAPAPIPASPSIDVFRLEPDGAALVAGTAAPGWRIEILLDGASLATATPARDGKFAVFVDIPASGAVRVLTLRMAGPDDGAAPVMGDNEVIIAPTTQAVAGPARIKDAPAAEPPVATRPADDAGQGAAMVAGGPDAEPLQSAPEMPPRGALPAAAPSGAGNIVARPVTPPAATAPTADEPAAPARAGTVTASNAASAADGTGVSTPESALIDVARSPDAQTTAPGLVGADTVQETAPAAAAPEQSAPATFAPTVLMADAAGVRVLQQPASGPSPQAMSRVALDAISYSADGDVQLSGRATGHGIVRIYLDNRAIITSRIDAAGMWRTGLPQVDTGIYTLRIDEVNADGAVTSRVETPFKREDRALLVELQASGLATVSDTATLAIATQTGTNQTASAAPVRAVTVQPGNTLWAISRERYGEGILYVRVFEANSDRIRDADQI
jgi:nucleoid-associated protein YgaU